MQVVDLRLNDNMEVVRIVSHQQAEADNHFPYPDFPMIFYDISLDNFIDNRIHWHWHKTFELFEVISGSFSIRTSKSAHQIKTGDVCFINAKILHSLDPLEKPEDCLIRVNGFTGDLISGGPDTFFNTRYIIPVVECRDLDMFHFTDQGQHTAFIKEKLAQSRALMENAGFAYDLDIRQCMTDIWKILFQEFQPFFLNQSAPDARDEERMKAMLTYIRSNYNKKISLPDIANAASISERECFRCFKKMLDITPNNYLQNYRMRMAVRQLLETNDSIFTISQSCGFADNSYFGKTFQKYFHCSPTEYRRRQKEKIALHDL
ncbi:MAG: helix-turn-helix domain-containing protein [Clostridiales bacterium]|nr:helix-turn-helix domain-containing protein [Clostridiales bacterium]